MSQIVIADQPAYQMRLMLPLQGAWVADFFAGDSTPITGAVKAQVLDGDRTLLELNGTVKRGGVYTNSNQIRVVGGAAGLAGTARARAYQNNVTLRSVLNDLAADAGERISSTSDTALLATNLGRWTTVATTIATLFEAAIGLCSTIGIYRVLPDGSIFVGEEQFEDFTEDFQILDEHPEDERINVGLFAPTLLPGMMLDDRRITYVEHSISAEHSTTTAWYSNE